MSTGGKAARAAIVAALSAMLVTVSPAESGACACGAFVADDKLSAQQETALVDLTGRTESITLSVLARSSADEAAFLMPVPARARFEVADADLFAELDEISKPDVEVRQVEVDGDGAGGAAPELTFAGPVEPGAGHPVLSEMLPGKRFLTRYDGEFAPDLIEDDIRITTAASDEPYRATVVVTEYVTSSWTAEVLAVIALVAAAVAVVVVAVVVLRRRRSRVDVRS
jgi:hypothetical protein